jgi:hypothetical protein
VLFIDAPSDETLSSLANTAKQSPSDDDASSSEAQTRESFPATEEITLMPPVPSEPRTFSPCTQDEPPAVDHVSFSMITKLPPSPRRRSQRDLRLVTSSPYKQSLVENIAEQNKKSKQKLSAFKEKKSMKAASMKQPKAKKAKTDNKKSAKAKNVNMNIVEDSQCPMCDGFWSESFPGEDWVQCCKCEKLLHEDCCCSVTPTTVICDICYDC